MKTNYLCGLFLLCVLVWGRSEAHAEKPLKTLDLYLCIGQSNMAGRGKLSPEVMDTLQNVYLLNADDQFEPAVNPLNRYSTIGKGLSWQQVGPAYGFAKTMATKKHPVGLIVNARGGSSIRSWVKNAKQSGGYYDEAIRRAKEAMKYGTLKAIIWHQGRSRLSSSGSI
ncbi:sialate O-acetylesterase [Bacteroides thetaiotaomicron]|nr:sialate O-acetylesterase [Bacteroides thetaiotaomicron]